MCVVTLCVPDVCVRETSPAGGTKLLHDTSAPAVCVVWSCVSPSPAAGLDAGWRGGVSDRFLRRPASWAVSCGFSGGVDEDTSGVGSEANVCSKYLPGTSNSQNYLPGNPSSEKWLRRYPTSQNAT